MSKVITWILIIIVVIGGIWYFAFQSPSSSAPATNGTTSQTTEQQAAADTSDAQLQADLAAVDSQVQAAGSASASAGTFNDTPVKQTE